MHPETDFSIRTFLGGYDKNLSYLVTCSRTGTQILVDAAIEIDKISEFFRNDPRGSFLTDFFSPSQELSLLFVITGFLYFKFLENKRTTYPL